MVFDEAADIEARQARMLIIFLIIATIVLLVLGVSVLYDEFKPLPNTPECKAAGFAAGIDKSGNMYCYDACETNDLNSCKERRLLI